MRFNNNTFGQVSQLGVIALVSPHSIAHGLPPLNRLACPISDNYEQYNRQGYHAFNTVR